MFGYDFLNKMLRYEFSGSREEKEGKIARFLDWLDRPLGCDVDHGGEVRPLIDTLVTSIETACPRKFKQDVISSQEVVQSLIDMHGVDKCVLFWGSKNPVHCVSAAFKKIRHVNLRAYDYVSVDLVRGKPGKNVNRTLWILRNVEKYECMSPRELYKEWQEQIKIFGSER